MGLESQQAFKAAAAPRVPRQCLDTDHHRPKKGGEPSFFGIPDMCAVARKIPRGRWDEPVARAALDKEWNKLATQRWPDKRGSGCWDISRVREAADVRKEARAKGT